jgi:hypothetical protein
MNSKNTENMFSCTLLNVTGDVTIAWDDSTSSDVKKWIQNKLDDGFTFFIVEPKFKIFKSKTKITSSTELKDKNGHVVITDEQASELFGNINPPKITEALPSEEKDIQIQKDGVFYSSLDIVKKKQMKLGDESAENLVKDGKVIPLRIQNNKEQNVKKVSSNPDEIVKSNTIVTRRMMGG